MTGPDFRPLIWFGIAIGAVVGAAIALIVKCLT